MMRVGGQIPGLTWDNEAGPKGAGNTRRSLTHSLDSSEEGLMPQRTHVSPTNTRSPRQHVWQPTTNTLAVWQCRTCDAIGFDPHPLPEGPCIRTGWTR